MCCPIIRLAPDFPGLQLQLAEIWAGAVLAYPKVRLQSVDLERLLVDLLPWCETWSAAIPSSRHCCRFSTQPISSLG